MSESGTKRVLVEARAKEADIVVADFRSRQTMSLSRRCHVTVELTDEELELTGEHFIEAVREALKRTGFGDNTAMLYTDEKIRTPSPISQILGRRMNTDDIALTDRWRYAGSNGKNS